MTRRRIYFTRNGFPCEPYELETEPEMEPRLQINTDGHYADARATDGTNIGSRMRHREYMRSNNLTVADDFKGEWAKKAEERARFHSGDWDKKGRTEAVERAIYQLESGQKRGR